MLRTSYRVLLLSVSILFYGCGGSSSSGPETPANDENGSPVLTGVLVDSAVEGVSFNTDTQSGTTNADGEFLYLDGETIVFSIGDLDFPTVPAAASISPIELSAGSTDTDATATNIARLLQSLDQDGNPYNGITIPSGAAANSTSVDFNVSAGEFESNSNVINMVANSGSINTSIVSAEDANVHLYQITTLEDYTDKVVGKQLVFKNEDGSRDGNTQSMVNLDGTITGSTPDGVIAMNWNWEDQFLCRSGLFGGTNFPVNCQVHSVNNGSLTIVLDRGTGGISTRWFIE